MTALAGGLAPPAVKFPTIGSRGGGKILDFADIPETQFNSRDPKTFKDGSTILQTRITVEQPDGSRLSLYIAGKRMKDAVRAALKAANVGDVSEFSTIYVTLTGTEPGKGSFPANTYTAEYIPFDPTV